MKRTAVIIGSLAILLNAGMIAPQAAGPIWTDPAKASAENPDFSLQGEYIQAGKAFQVIALGKGQFHVSVYNGGLPGVGWDRSSIGQIRGNTEEIKALTQHAHRVTRQSPRMGAKPPANATILFDGTSADAWDHGKLSDGLLESGTQTKQSFGDFELHIEFRLPFKPETTPGSQDRGNSGIYSFNRYETQVLDSFGLDLDINSWKEKPQSDPKQWCGCLYKFKLADTNMCFPPLTWQTYDIHFTAPRFEGDKKTRNARITVIHNGIKIHDDVELPKGTGAGGSRKEIARGPIVLQGHGNPVRYRNIWIVEK
ncbi:MAG: DUF1080 domain-containing protein [Verrucomicrobia bacterium]|nr:DUF1080 domain-containing protein [Verrucomicrobiota bacterium]MBT7874485.1 DUF1080 domain-containing protein [Verrucomicrobiota bacterium]